MKAPGTSTSTRMRNPWETHLSAALALSAVAFAVWEFGSELAGAALFAAALFVALRPLFRNDLVRAAAPDKVPPDETTLNP
jgi:multisubunit Na+/H+ antiporter MnhG subunit